MVKPQWTHLCRFAIYLTSKFSPVESSSRFHQFWKANLCGNWGNDSTWIRLSKSTKNWWVLHVDFSMSYVCTYKNVRIKGVYKKTFMFGSIWKHWKTSESKRFMNVPMSYVLKKSFPRPLFPTFLTHLEIS